MKSRARVNSRNKKNRWAPPPALCLVWFTWPWPWIAFLGTLQAKFPKEPSFCSRLELQHLAKSTANKWVDKIYEICKEAVPVIIQAKSFDLADSSDLLKRRILKFIKMGPEFAQAKLDTSTTDILALVTTPGSDPFCLSPASRALSTALKDPSKLALTEYEKTMTSNMKAVQQTQSKLEDMISKSQIAEEEQKAKEEAASALAQKKKAKHEAALAKARAKGAEKAAAQESQP
jgi:hypothetical protein